MANGNNNQMLGSQQGISLVDNLSQALSGGGMTEPPQAGIGTTPGPNPIADAMRDTEGQGGDLGSLLSDPNFQVFLSQLGSRISQGQEVGEALGGATTQAIQRGQYANVATGQQGTQTFGTGQEETGPSETGYNLDSIVNSILGED